ncbi:MAG: hypothetical protein ABI863_07365 [Ginsengibacter sp.]
MTSNQNFPAHTRQNKWANCMNQVLKNTPYPPPHAWLLIMLTFPDP